MASTATVGNLQYVISVQTAQLIDARRDIAELRRQVDDLASASTSVNKLETSFTALASAVASVVSAGGIAFFIKEISMAVGQQKIFADSIGTSYEQLQRLQYVAGQFGVEADGMNDALKELNMQINEAARGDNDDLVNRLQEMGIAMSDIKNLSPDEQFIKLAEGMSNLSDQSRKVLIANDLLGEESTKLIKVMEQGSDAVREYAQQADKLSIVLSDQVASDFVAFNQSLDKTTKALSGIGIQAIASYADEMKSISDSVVGFLSDGEKVQNIIDGIGTAALATSTIIAGRLVAALSAWAIAQGAAVAATVAASAGLASLSGLSVIAAARLITLTAATRAFAFSLSILGGPVGVIAAVAGAIALMVYNSKKSESAISSLNSEMKDFKTTLSGLSDVQLADQLKKDTEELENSLRKVQELESSIRELQETFNKTGSIKALKEANEQLKELEEYRNKLARSSFKVKFEMQADSERAAKKAVSDIASTFDNEKIDIDINDLIETSGSLDLSKSDGLKKINEDLDKAIKKVNEKYSQIPVLAMTYKEAEAQVVEKYNKKIQGLEEKGADISAVKKARDNEIQYLERIYSKKAQIVKAKEDQITALEIEAEEKRSKIRDDAAKKQETAQKSIVQALRNAQVEIASEKDKVTISEKEALDALSETLNEYPELQSLVEEARTAIKEAAAKKRSEINARELKEEEDNQARYIAILDSARRSIASSEDLIVMNKQKELDNLEKIGKELNKSTEDLEEVRALINQKYAQQESDLAEKRIKDAEAKAKEIASKRKAFFGIGVDNSELSTLKKLEMEERDALNDLIENWDKAIISEEEYYQKRQEIQDRYSKEKSDVKSANTSEIKEIAAGSESESLGSKIDSTYEEEKKRQEELQKLYEDSNATYEEFEAARNEIAQKYADERNNIYSSAIDVMLSSASEGFGSIADALKSSGEESSTAYKAMFALSKGFAIAQAGLNLSLAISNALASAPFPANIGAMASVASSGASLVSAVSGATYSGRQNGGDISSGNMYKVNERGTPEIYSYGNEDYLMGTKNAKITPISQFMSKSGSSGANVSINNYGTNTSVSTQPGLTDNDVILIVRDTVPTEINNVNSKTSRAMKKSTNSRRRLS